MILVAHHDFETASVLDLRKVGVHRYAEHPSTRVWCMSWWPSLSWCRSTHSCSGWSGR